MSDLQRQRVERTETTPFNAVWSVKAPWAHPLWHSYVTFLYDLTTPVPKRDAAGGPVFHMEGATHEFLLYALDPDQPVPEITDDPETWRFHRLQPANHGYQFIAESDDAAFKRLDELMVAINRGTLSPDTDFTRAWDKIFADGVTLKRSIFDPPAGGQPAGHA